MGRRKAAAKPEGGGSKRRRTSAPNPKRDENVKGTKGKSTGGGNAAKISKSEASAGGAIHPLLIPHVLEKVFQHSICPKSDGPSRSQAKNVQNLRLVCKQWKDTATRLYLRNRAPKISFGNHWESPSTSRSPNKKMQNFLDVVKSSNLIPVQRYTLEACFFRNENQKLMKDFLRICGPDAVELRILWDPSCTMKFTRRTFPVLNLMRLKSLVFQWKHYFYPTYEMAYLIEAVLGAAGTLQELEVTFPNVGKWSQPMAKRFGDCISGRVPKNLKILDLVMPLSDFHLNTLAGKELKLEELQFDSECGASSKEIDKFLKQQATTLKTLKILEIQVESFESTISLTFPRFDELLDLELRGATQNFSFPDTFPKLTSLDVAEWETESTWVELLNCTKKVVSLTEIHLPYYFAQAQLVKKVAQCFPNINKLHIYPSDDLSETLQEVFVYFENIEELYINFTDLVDEFNADSVFSGVSPNDCRKIMKQRNFDDMNFRNFQHLPSILNLAKLKKLVLQSTSWGNDIHLTDFSVRFVFLKMASLNELYTNACGDISPGAVRSLREKLSLKLTGDDESDSYSASNDSFGSGDDEEDDDDLYG